MDVLGNLVGGQACAADGTTAARNPLSRLVDTLMEGSAGGQQQKGRSRRAFNPAQGAAMMRPPPGAAAAAAAQAQGMPGEMVMGPDMGAARGGQWIGPPQHRNASHGPGFGHQGNDWANEFGGHGPHPQQPFSREFEGAWDAGAGGMMMQHPHAPPHTSMEIMAPGGAWANEFHHGPAPQGMMPPPHPAELEAAWAAQHGGGGGAHGMAAPMMMRGPPGVFAGGPAVHSQQVVPAPGAAGLEEAWAEDAQEAGAGVGGGLEAAWGDGAAASARAGVREGSFSDAWTGLDSGVGVREEPSLAQQQHAASAEEEAWAEAGGKGEAALRGSEDSELHRSMEAAWAEASGAADNRGVSSLDPDLEAVWEDQEPGVETLEGVWGRTAARLEAGEYAAGAREETPYELSAENRFSDLSDPFEEGVRLFEEGQIADAVLCFEAEISRNPENSQAWFMLGQSHAENDQDRLAISCLERAVDMDPYSLDALLALGTSYVNELDSQRALHNLKAWVQHNPKYSGLEIAVDEYSDGTLMDEVMQLMLQAQRWDASDADAHVVLGVLYNVSRDYDSAAEAFRRALEARPNDHSLWNKLGATLANHRRSDEALPAYRRAISSKPGYARAWLNMGISQANLNRYEEASSCYLQALRLNPEAKHIWSYLRIVFTSMERFDLVQKAGQEDAKLFEEDFDLALPTAHP